MIGRPGASDRCGRESGFTLMELLLVMSLIGVMVGIAAPRYTEYRNRLVPDQASSIVGNYVALTRSYAIQSRRGATLKVNPVALTMEISVDGAAIRTMNMGVGGDFELDTLDMDMAGDSVTFTARGVCAQCGVTGTGAIIVATDGGGYLVTYNAVGVWKKTRR
jgi:prepilin-type N-terminal cleavage/methylation domain-containing protein